MHTAECDISVWKLLGLETFPFFLDGIGISLKNFSIKKNIGTSFKKIWYRKKYRIRFRKILVSKRVSDLVSKKKLPLKSIWKKSKSIGIQKVWIVENVQISKVSRLLKTYSGENSNKRNECDYASSRANHLRTHLKRHSGRIQTNITNVTLSLLM